MSIVNQADQWLSGRSPQAYSLWAKSGTEDAYLRLPQHLIDSACVAEWLWENWVSDSLKSAMSRAWNLDEALVQRLYCFLAGTHDVGKATVAFQRQVETRPDKKYLLSEVESAGLPLTWPMGEEGQKFPHGTASALILKEWLQRWGLIKLQATRIAAVVDAHHGFTSDPQILEQHQATINNYPEDWAALQKDFIDSMAELCEIDDVLDEFFGRFGPFADAVHLMTGLVIMADWIASNEKWFPYSQVLSQEQRVRHAMETAQLPKPWQPVSTDQAVEKLFQQTFGWSDDYKVRPVQEAAVQIVRTQSGPCLMIIEAPTGEGKTEAGLAAAHVIGDKTGAQGVFFAAPTMSTANGLFDRTTNWVKKSSRGGEVASMYLAHSKNQLSEQYQALRFSGIGEDTLSHGAAVAHQWLSGRRVGILSDFVVGTVDQVLMMALQARFSMLRHVGLAGKIIIIDEVHAYDAYMSQYLHRALEWLARYGVSVILMSATLPPAQRRALAEAYASQVVSDADFGCLESSAYPLISTVSAKGVEITEIPARPADLKAQVSVIDDSLTELTARLQDLLIDGGVALVICNTIARSQETYVALEEAFPGEVELHHSAFIAAERSAKEDVLRDKLGPRAHRGNGRPNRAIVVATQVAEQSLDIDADVLVTDIAPIDLVIQRIGRLHRHHRPEDDRPNLVRDPKVFVRGIITQDPVPEFDGGAKAVYGKKLLLATMAYLPTFFRRPDDVAGLVRNVYSSEPAIPTAWQREWEGACIEAARERQSAERRADTFRFPSPGVASDLHALFQRIHSESEPGQGDEERGYAQVRDSEPSVEAVVIEASEYGYRPFGLDVEFCSGFEPTYSQAKALAANSIRLPGRMTRRNNDFDAVIDDLERNTPGEWSKSGLLKGQVALVLDSAGTATVGRFELQYTRKRGLEIVGITAN